MLAKNIGLPSLDIFNVTNTQRKWCAYAACDRFEVAKKLLKDLETAQLLEKKNNT
jgi:hypothetical protein